MWSSFSRLTVSVTEVGSAWANGLHASSASVRRTSVTSGRSAWCNTWYQRLSGSRGLAANEASLVQKPKGGIWTAYLNLLETRPVLTRSVTCALLNGTGDVFCQLVVEGHSEVNLRRLGIFSILGLLYVGPVVYLWFSLLSKIYPSGCTLSVIKSVSMDQLLFAPFIISSIMAAVMASQGASLEGVLLRLHRDLVPVLTANWMVWVPAQTINFAVIVPKLRVLFSNIVGLVWNVYMSYKVNKSLEQQQQNEPQANTN